MLTERESQVLRAMSDGKSNRCAGKDLFLTEDTIKTHASALFHKLGARDRAQYRPAWRHCGSGASLQFHRAVCRTAQPEVVVAFGEVPVRGFQCVHEGSDTAGL